MIFFQRYLDVFSTFEHANLLKVQCKKKSNSKAATHSDSRYVDLEREIEEKAGSY